MQRYVVANEALDSTKKRNRGILPLPCRRIQLTILWTLLLLKDHTVRSFTSRDGNDTSFSSFSLSIVTMAEANTQRELQSAPASSPTKTYAARRINAGGESEYIDTSGVSWGADNWYGDKGRRTTPSECTKAIFNTTDDILYCSNRFYPTTTVSPPYRYNIPIPYPAWYEIRLHFAETVRGFKMLGAFKNTSLLILLLLLLPIGFQFYWTQSI